MLVEIDISEKDTFSDAVVIHAHFNLSLLGTWDGTLTIQRSFNDGVLWRDVGTFTSNTEEYGFEPGHGVLYRIGFKDGDYADGSVNIRMGK